MFERSEPALKILCGALAVLVVFRLAMMIAHLNPLYHLKIPELPALASAATNSTETATNSQAIEKSVATKTNHTSTVVSTNSGSPGSNVLGQAVHHEHSVSNRLAQATNVVGASTNLLARGTNLTSQATNSPAKGTNSAPLLAESKPATLSRAREGRRGLPGGPMRGMPSPGPALPPELQARIDRVIESEILAPVMRPLPMALLGIAGNQVFLRAPDGQTGLVKEGDELGGVKLVRIGVNRVLVEEQGERKELTIFAGLGSDSLLSTKTESPK